MKLGFNSRGAHRSTPSVAMGKLRNTVASTTRKFKFCNTNSPDLNTTLQCVFHGPHVPYIHTFDNYHVFNSVEIPLEQILEEGLPEEQPPILTKSTSRKSVFNGPFTPNHIKRAYTINPVIPLTNIRRPIVTIVAAFNNPYLNRDIASFGRIFGLPPCNYSIHNFSRVFSSSWAVEVTMNAQWVYAMNPYAQIRIVLAASNSAIDMLNAVNYANNKNNFRPAVDTDIMTMSWGTEDNGSMSSYNTSFTNPNTIYMASSGNNSKVSVPSCCTNVLSIGGTSLTLNSSFTREAESVWANSGCGFSRSFAKPAYQPALHTNNLRVSPDVSCVADANTPCIIIINNRAYTIGGTSLASPIYAGMLSILTQHRLNNRRFTYTSVANRFNSIQPLLYPPNNASCFFDVTQGSSGGFSASPGFDLASGNGVLNAAELVNKLG